MKKRLTTGNTGSTGKFKTIDFAFPVPPVVNKPL
jgi:hypothetical protein